MANIDDEILKGAEEDAREVEYIMNYLPQELKEKFTEDDIYYIIDVMLEYIENSKQQPDDDGSVEFDVEDIAKHVVKKAKKEDMGSFEVEDVEFVVNAEFDYNEEYYDE